MTDFAAKSLQAIETAKLAGEAIEIGVLAGLLIHLLQRRREAR